jgi:hypothetical protein
MGVTEESRRLQACAREAVPWKKWGPYLSERQWGTVREDYSPEGNAWDHFTHDQARSRAYRWGEDGLGGICDHKQRLCFGLALWNGQDPILKERLYGLTNGESNTGMFGGNSNWRGPIWMPVNVLLVRALLQFYVFYGDTFRIECPTGSGQQMTLFEVAREISRRLSAIFLRDASGRRPVYGGVSVFQEDPHWRDLIAFHEYFHGDNGAGLGASHQTGWTGAVAKLIQLFGYLTPQDILQGGSTRPIMSDYRAA